MEMVAPRPVEIMVAEVHVARVQMDRSVAEETVFALLHALENNVEMMDVVGSPVDLVHRLKHVPTGFVLEQQ